MKGPQKDPFDWLQDSESPLFFGVGVIINSAVNPEVSLVSRCQARLCPEGVICSRSSAPLPSVWRGRTMAFPSLSIPQAVIPALCLCLTITASLAFCIEFVTSSQHWQTIKALRN